VNGASRPNSNRHRARITPLASTAENYFGSYCNILEDLPYGEIEQVTARLLQAYDEGRTVFLFGNGGSAALASHFACDLGKGTLARCGDSKRFRAVSLTDNLPLITAWANDVSYDRIFAEQLRSLVVAGDISFAISGSGNSSNVLSALEVARSSGSTTIGMTGYLGGRMKALCDYCIVVPSDNMQLIEDFHLSISHALFLGICQRIARSTGFAVASTSGVQCG
jgi:D-sedoheptulose 7-phosphate isomerase